MRIATLLLVLAYLTPSLAIRGEKGRATRVRDLRNGEKDKDKAVFEEDKNKAPKEEPKEPKEPKDEKEKAPKDPKAKSKDPKDKKDKKCKKAKKGKKSKKDKEHDLVRRYAEVVQEDVRYCLHSDELSADECAQVKKGSKLPKDGSVRGDLSLELVHSEDQEPAEILQSVNGILSDDTNPRFVGCESMEAPPPPKSPKRRQTRTRRFLEEYITVPEVEDIVDVTGFSFEDLDIVSGGCKTDTTLSEGAVCDSIRTNVEIYYKAQGEVSQEDKEDMYNLLVETILAQASVGSFNTVGNVASVQIGESSGTGTGQSDTDDDAQDDTTNRGDLNGTTDTSTDESGFSKNKGPILGAAAGFVALFGAGYWYAMGEDDNEEKHEQTDESDSD